MKSLFTLIFSLCLLSFLQAQDGTLDKTFGTNGIVLTPGYEQQGYSAAVQPDDKVVVGGLDGGDSTGTNFLLIRYLPDGGIDSSFGNKGIATHHLSYDRFFGNVGWTAVQVQPDGKIVATGYAYDGIKNYEVIVLARYKEDGTPDSSFGSNGSVITDLGGNELANAMTLQPDGKIVVTGRYGSKVLTLRYNTDGSFDKTFNGAGYVIYPVNNGSEAFAAVVQPDGKILIGGTYLFPGRFFMLRYLPNGLADETFGNKGQVITDFANVDPGAAPTQINSLLLLPDNSILAGGVVGQGFELGDNMVVVKYKGDGNIDNSFGIEGKAILRFKEGNSDVHTLLQQADGKLLMAGGAIGSAYIQGDFAMARLLPDGRVDSSFGKNGTTVTDLGLGYIDQCYSAVMQKNGKVVLAGLTFDVGESGFQSFSLARYNTGGEGQPRPIVARLKRLLHNHGISWTGTGNASYYSVERNGGAGFREVARIQGNTVQRDYTYAIPASSANDASPATRYYRVAAVSAGGQRTVSNAVAVSLTDAQAVSVYPNPVQNQLAVKGLDAAADYKITVRDVAGTVYSTLLIRQQATATVDVSRLKPGSYVLTLGNAGVNNMLTFIKQ